MTAHVENFAARGGHKNDQGEITDQREFRVDFEGTKTNSGVDCLNYVVGTIGIDIGTAHPDEALMTCVDISFIQWPGTNDQWKVGVKYSTNQADPDQSNSDPTTNGVKKDWSTVKFEEVMEEDVNGDAVVNTANEPFSDPPVMRTRSIIKWTYVRNETLTDAAVDAVIEAYVNKINSAVFNGKALDLVYCEDISGRREWKNGSSYVVMTYVFLYDANGFYAEPLNAGLRELNDAGDLVRIVDDNNEPVTTMYPLDAAGKAIPKGDLPGAAITDLFWPYESANFAALGLV